MKSVLVRSLVMMVASLVAVSHLAACNTVKGAGKDTERVGEKVQDMADDAKR